jgi:hypothetical protein
MRTAAKPKNPSKAVNDQGTDCENRHAAAETDLDGANAELAMANLELATMDHAQGLQGHVQRCSRGKRALNICM